MRFDRVRMVKRSQPAAEAEQPAERQAEHARQERVSRLDDVRPEPPQDQQHPPIIEHQPITAPQGQAIDVDPHGARAQAADRRPRAGHDQVIAVPALAVEPGNLGPVVRADAAASVGVIRIDIQSNHRKVTPAEPLSIDPAGGPAPFFGRGGKGLFRLPAARDSGELFSVSASAHG